MAKRRPLGWVLCMSIALLALVSPRVAAAKPTGCVSSRLPRPAGPVLTDTQATSALHQRVTLAGRSSGGGALGCRWNGSPVAASPADPYRHYQVQLWLTVRGPFANRSAARAYYEPQRTVFGTPTNAAGLGTAAVFRPGQDEVTSQLLVLAGNYVIEVSLNSSLQQGAQRADVAAVADTVLARLGLGPTPAPAPKSGTHPAPVRWTSDWAGRNFCRTKRAGYQFLHASWGGVAACGAAYPNNYQGKIAYKHVVFDTVGFQCVELAERYFYYVTGRAGPFANGSDLAEIIYYRYHRADPGLKLYPLGALGRTSQYRATLRAGDIVSLWSDSDEVGHVGVVTKTALHNDRDGVNGTITILDENASSSGLDTIDVTNGRLWFPNGSYPYFQWLYGLPAPPSP